MPRVIVNISFCCEHRKGGDLVHPMNGQEHAEWLDDCCVWWLKHTPWPLFVSMTGFRGWPEVPNAPGYFERDVLWRCFGRERVRFVPMAANPGHQVGAAWCIRLGLEAAGKLGYDYLIHTAEDVLPYKWAPRELIGLLNQTEAEFVDERWGVNRDECNAQFFACRVPYLAGVFDPTAIPRHDHLEAYLRDILKDKKIAHCEPSYRTTHDFAEWKRWVEEQK
jgi:hypothetical protein